MTATQLPIAFPAARARRTDPVESIEAAARVNVSKLEQMVLFALRMRPMTTHEIANDARVSLVSISPRLAPMQRRGLVERTGERRDGRAVWRIIPTPRPA